MAVKRSILFSLKLLIKVPLALITLLLTTYYYAPVFDFERGVPFEGAKFYNPYADLSSQQIRGNFHAHARAWGGVTNGKTPAKEVVQLYVDLGYDLPGISNYNMLEDPMPNAPIHLPMYEHGLNVGFVHQIVVNPSEATLLDYPFYQNRSHRQATFNRLREDDNLIMVAHPSSRAGYSYEDLAYLSGYELMEIISVQAVGPDHWDATLSTGHPVWGIANDDCHDTTDYDIGLCWNIIYVSDTSRASILNSLRQGKHFAVKGWQAKDMNELEYIRVTDEGLYTIKLVHPADSITLIADQGERVVIGTGVDSLSFQMEPQHTYLRAEVFESEPWNDWTKMFFNPVIRSEDVSLSIPPPSYSVNWPLTILYWLFIFLCQALLVRTLIRW